MLNKDICIKCRNTNNHHMDYMWANGNVIETPTMLEWTTTDDNEWDIEERIICNIELYNFANKYPTSIHNPPPQKCPYTLEHLMK